MSELWIDKVEEYDFNKVYSVIKKHILNLENENIIIKEGMKVGIKPNLVMKKSPDEAATTNPVIVKAVGRIIKEKGARAYLIESPGGPFTKARLKGVYTQTGMKKVCLEEEIILNENIDSIDVKNPDGLYLKQVTIVEELKKMDLLINLPKLKTHGQMVYTGALKNMFGAVPGVLKAEYHFRMPDYDKFANALIDVFLSVKPEIQIMDGIVAMEGHGPTAGEKKNMKFIMTSQDAFLLDLAGASLMNLSIKEVPMLRQSNIRGLLDETRLGEYESVLKQFRQESFKVPAKNQPKYLDFSDKTFSGYFMKLLRPKPVFDEDKCILCCECVVSCPAKVLSVKEGKIAIDLDNCIRCYCCQELCPKKAVTIRQGILISLYMKLKNFLSRRKA